MRKPLALLAPLVFLLCSPALAGVPHTINYQGHLSASGGPASGLLPFHFSIYDAESGGNLLWADMDTLDVVNGLFSAQLGANTPIPTIVFNTPTTWLETAVNGQALAPRIPFASVPYAQFAQHADTANVATSYSGPGQWSSDGTNVYRASGRVGIGTANPTATLEIASTNGFELKFSGTEGANIYAPDQTLYLEAGPSQSLSLGSNGQNGQVVLTNGLLGIGTIPMHQLTVAAPENSVGLGVFNPAGDNNTNSPFLMLTGGYRANNGVALRGVSDAPWGEKALVFYAGWDEGALGDNPAATDLHERMRISSAGVVTIAGNLSVTGTKCRAVEDAKYGTLYYNAVESGHALFTLDGEAQLKDGVGWVSLDPKWLAGVTIDDQHPMQVWVTFYGPHGEYYIQRVDSNNGFKVVETSGSNAAFGWKVEARQKGYEDVYLNRPSQIARSEGGRP